MPATNLTIRQIQVFLSVAELGNFTRAAERLHVAQSALSQQVRDLETELGIRLFDRTTRRVELTEGGREFRHAAEKIIEDIEIAERNARGIAERTRGRLAVAAPPLLAAVIVPPAIADFHSQHPGVRVILVDAGTDRIVEQVRSGQVDCGLGTFRAGEDGIHAMPLARDRLMLFCREDHPLSRQTQIEWRALQGLPLIALTRDSGIRLLIEIGFEAAETPLVPAYEVSQITTALAMVEAGLGVAVLPTYAWVAARGRKLAAVALADPSIERDIVMIIPADRSVSPAVSAFSRTLGKHTRALLPDSPASDAMAGSETSEAD